jgi:hypothetical protein
MIRVDATALRDNYRTLATLIEPSLMAFFAFALSMTSLRWSYGIGSLLLVGGSMLLIVMASVSSLEGGRWFMIGIVLSQMSLLAGLVCINYKKLPDFDLRRHQGYFYRANRMSWSVFIVVLLLVGFPMLPGYYFEDISLLVLWKQSVVSAFLGLMAHFANGLSLLRWFHNLTMGYKAS